MLGWSSAQVSMMLQFSPRLLRLAPRRPGRRLSLALLLALGLAGSLGRPDRAQAHAIESTLVRLQALRNTLELQTHFSTGVPLDGAAVRLVSADGQRSLALGRTDSLGALRFQLPAAAGPDWELQVDGGAGHRDYLELPSRSNGPQAQQPIRPPAGEPAAAPLALMVVGMVSGGLIWRRRHP
jgi:hypothetical protein